MLFHDITHKRKRELQESEGLSSVQGNPAASLNSFLHKSFDNIHLFYTQTNNATPNQQSDKVATTQPREVATMQPFANGADLSASPSKANKMSAAQSPSSPQITAQNQGVLNALHERVKRAPPMKASEFLQRKGSGNIPSPSGTPPGSPSLLGRTLSHSSGSIQIQAINQNHVVDSPPSTPTTPTPTFAASCVSPPSSPMQPPPPTERKSSVDVHAFIQQVHKHQFHSFGPSPSVSRETLLSPTSSNSMPPTSSSTSLSPTSSFSSLYSTWSKESPSSPMTHSSKPPIIIPPAAAAAAISSATAAAAAIMEATSSTENLSASTTTTTTTTTTTATTTPTTTLTSTCSSSSFLPEVDVPLSELHRYLPAPPEPCDNIVVIPSVVVHSVQHALPDLSLNHHMKSHSFQLHPQQPPSSQAQQPNDMPTTKQTPTSTTTTTTTINTSTSSTSIPSFQFHTRDSFDSNLEEQLFGSARSFHLSGGGAQTGNRSYMKLPSIHTLFAQLGHQRSEPDLNSLASLVVNMTN